MATTYTDLFATVKRSTKEVSLEEVKRRLDAKEPYTLVDVREKDEVRAGYIPGAVSIPRGFLEIQVEGRLPDKNAKIVAYCAGGTRSALAAKTLQDLGYANVETANPGFGRWKDLGYPVETPPSLTEAQRDRYSRHLLLPEVGEIGQAKLLKSKILMIGAGGLGSPSSLYLAAAGVGTIGLVDADTVDASNLQRQILHATSRVGMPKVESAEKMLRDLNPDVKVVSYKERVDSSNVERLFSDYDVIVDGTDNFPTRYLVNDASVWMGKPVVHGSIFRFDGQLTTFVPDKAAAKLGITAGPCYRCLYPGAAARAPRAELPGGRRPRHPPRCHRRAASDGGGEASPRQGRAARRPPADVRQPQDEVSRAPAPPRSVVPGLRSEPDDHGIHRLRRLLRDPGLMGLTLRVGPATAVFAAPHGDVHTAALRDDFGLDFAATTDPTWTSEDLGWSWIGELQKYAKDSPSPQLAACNSWLTVYLPRDLDVTSYTAGKSGMVCGSAKRLLTELDRLAAPLQIPSGTAEQEALLQRYLDEDGFDADDDAHLQAYLWLAKGAREALASKLPLWIVK